MPVTYNGIGTHYYGKKNIEKRPGPCPHCNRATELTSYDTRLWFVIVFIPVFPLARKRIIDYCPICTRHYAVDARKWETAKQLEISGALDEYRANPTPEGAIAVHQQYLKFHQRTQAAEFEKKMVEQYAANAKVQAYLGAALEHVGKRDEAAVHFTKALELRPDLPEARIGVARGHIRAGRLDEARALLDFLEKQGAAQLYSLQPLEALAIAYQKANRHAEALELFGRLQAELPNIGEVKGFRELVKKSETAMGKKESMLAKQKFSWKRFLGTDRAGRSATASPRVTWRALALLGVLLGLVCLGLVISNEYIRRHRKVYFVNAFPQAARVDITGKGHLFVRRTSDLVLPEGRYHAVITGPVREELDFEVRSDYFSRWAGDPVWLINIGGAAVLTLETVVYAEDPPPGSLSFHYGKPFEFYPQVTHPFEDLPETLQMKHNETRTLVHLDLYNRSGLGAFQYELDHGSPTQAPTLAEQWLRSHPPDKALLRHYADYMQKRQPERLDRFLKSGLTNRPVDIDWHRAYQRIHDKPADIAKLKSDYDEMLRNEPTNSALVYLCGRICADREKSRALYRRASELDPKNPFAHFGLGYDRMAAGDWVAARAHLARAVELSPDDPYSIQSLLMVRLALGEADAVESELRAILRQKPLDYATEIRLLETLFVKGNREATLQEVSDFEKKWLAKNGVRGQEPLTSLKQFAFYGVGDFAELEKSAARDKSTEGKAMLEAALLEQGKIEAAPHSPDPAEDLDEKPWHDMGWSIAYGGSGNQQGAREWLDRAIKTMKNGSEDFVQAASLLESATPPTDADIENVLLPPRAKAMLLTALGQKFPQAAPQLFAQARKFNIERSFPYHLMNRVTSAAPPTASQ